MLNFIRGGKIALVCENQLVLNVIISNKANIVYKNQLEFKSKNK
jgi:hypothetical protein